MKVVSLAPFVEFNLPYRFENSAAIRKKVDLNSIISVKRQIACLI